MSNVVNNQTDPYQLEEIIKIFKDTRLSAHYLIDREGTVYKLVEEDRIAKHAGEGKRPYEPEHKDNLNAYSIGIELMAIGTQEETEKAGFLSEEQYKELDETHIGFTEKQ